MEILKHGIAYYNRKCSKCNCEFGFNIKDLQYAVKNYDELDYFVYCPECGNKIDCNELIIYIK